MTGSSQRYNLGTLSQLMIAAFDTEELRALVMYDENLSGLAAEFAPAHSITTMVRKTIAWCDRRKRIPYLVQLVKEKRFEKFKEYEAALLITDAEPTVTAIRDKLSRIAQIVFGKVGRAAFVAFIVLAILIAAVIGVMNYRQRQQTPEYWIERFQGTKSADVRIVSLARLVDVTDGEEDAQRLFFEKLTAAEQVAMFAVSDPEGLTQDLVVVIKTLYGKLDNSPQGNSILEAMSEALPERSHLPAGVATELSLELEYWQRGQSSQSEGDYLSAVDCYALAIGQNGANPSTRIDLASAYAALERFPDSLAELGRAVKLDPSKRYAVEQVVNGNEGLYTYLGLHRAEYRDIAGYFPTLTPTPQPTSTPTCTSTPTNTPTSTPIAPTSTNTPTPPPTKTFTSTPTSAPSDAPKPTPTPTPTDPCVPELTPTEGCLLVADFDNGRNTNNLCGEMGSVSDDIADRLWETYIDREEGKAVKLEYTIKDWTGFWLRLPMLDLTPYRRLEFDIRADAPVPTSIKIELHRKCTTEGEKTTCEEVEYKRIYPIPPQWKDAMTVELSAFEPTGWSEYSPLSTWQGMQELVFIFELANSGSEGMVYLDNIKFCE